MVKLQNRKWENYLILKIGKIPKLLKDINFRESDERMLTANTCGYLTEGFYHWQWKPDICLCTGQGGSVSTFQKQPLTMTNVQLMDKYTAFYFLVKITLRYFP